MSGSARLNLPFLSAGQSQKELIHNEALQVLDVIVAAAVEEAPQSSPPASPPVGACYIVGPSASGAWTGKEQSIAGFTSGGWRFVTPQEGLAAYVKARGTWACFRAGSWEIGTVRGTSLVVDGEQVVGSRGSAIDGPSGGTTVDAEARATIGEILATLRQHGLIES